MQETLFVNDNYLRSMPDPEHVRTFGDAKAAIAAIALEQIDGCAMQFTTCGTPYAVVMTFQLARPGDECVIESFVCKMAVRRIIEIIDDVRRKDRQASFQIQWRIRPEFQVADYPVVARYDDDGPDMDHVTDKRCHMDKNWRIVKFYARFAVVLAPALN